jgi:hypothetical protein
LGRRKIYFQTVFAAPKSAFWTLKRWQHRAQRQAITIESIADIRYTAKKMLKNRRKICLVTYFLRVLRFQPLISLFPVAFCFLSIADVRAQGYAYSSQERVRTAAGRLEIESFRKPEAFFTIGPLQEELIGTAGIEFDDNANLAHTGKVSRLRFYEALTLNTTWVLSELNRIEFAFGGKLNEDFYGNGKSQLNVGISPDSLIQFQFAAGDFLFHIYDRFSYIQDPTTDASTANTTYLNSLTNTIGARVDADFNLAILSLSADYTYNNRSGSNPESGTSSNVSGDRNTFRVSPSISFRLSPTMLYGVEATLGRATGSTTTGAVGSANINSLSVGPFIRGALSRLTDINFGVGANLLDAKPSVAPDYYFAAVVRHQFSPNLQLILSASHDILFTTGTDLTEETILQGAIQFKLTRFITFSSSSFVSFGNDLTGTTTPSSVSGIVPGNFKQYGAAATLTWTPRRRLSAILGYNFTRRDADTAVDTYSKNRIDFQINYTF